MRRVLRVCALMVVVLGSTLAASAQTALSDDSRSGVISAGAMVGGELDMSDNFLLFGADARVRVARSMELEPRFTYQPLNGGHITQLDANLLHNFELARPGTYRPFAGIGGAIRSVTPDIGNGETKLGLNLVAGARIAMSASSGYEPFVIAQYTIVHNQLNSMSVVVGASFRLRH